jgi:hypothetical protein
MSKQPLPPQERARLWARIRKRRRRAREKRDMKAVREYQGGEIERVWTPGGRSSVMPSGSPVPFVDVGVDAPGWHRSIEKSR